MNFLRILLFPLSMIYGTITWLRNKFFDWGVLPSRSFDHPLIGIGNLSTGGTGKTPHIEYLIQFLKPWFRVAILSRGYKRKTRGFKYAGPKSRVRDIGDEPLQMYLKHPETFVAVCENRKKGVKKILEIHSRNEVILLDDIFQHRYVKPGLNILLTDYHKIFTRNYVLPTGNLREFRQGAKRADALVVTKTPGVFSPLDRKLILDELSKYQIKNIFFSYIKYGKWKPVNKKAREARMQKAKTIFLITGIANPVPLGEHLKRLCTDLKVFRFSDHHQFTSKDLEKIKEKYSETFSGTKAVITTEKDTMRLRDPKLIKILENIPVYYVPIEVDFHQSDKKAFNKIVMDYMKLQYPKKVIKHKENLGGSKT
ncbi:MAG: tetraacyldisaccharide 4'-kinase [Bacteroidales bacterium]|nr:tetraacyldisaccharide 4'-kinase [Bacteroidales bacterium]